MEQERGFPGVFCDCSDTSACRSIAISCPTPACPRQRDRWRVKLYLDWDKYSTPLL